MNWDDILSSLLQAGVDRADAEAHVRYLRSAVHTRRPQIMVDYVDWCRRAEISRTGRDDGIQKALSVIQQQWIGPLSAALNYSHGQVSQFLAGVPDDPAPADEPILDRQLPHGELALAYYQHVRDTDRRGATRLVMDALDDGLGVADLYEHVFTPCLREIGRLWELNELSVGQEHYFTAVTQTVMAHIYPRIFSTEPGDYRLLAATIEGNLHEISIRMVADFFEMAGWDTHYLGADAPNEEIIRCARRHRPHVIGISIALTSQLDRLQDLVADIRADPQLAGTRIIIGGGGLKRLPEEDREVGADAYAATAAEAVKLAESWMAA